MRYGLKLADSYGATVKKGGNIWFSEGAASLLLCPKVAAYGCNS